MPSFVKLEVKEEEPVALAEGAVAPPVAHRRRRHTLSSVELLRRVRQLVAIIVTAAQLQETLTLATQARVAVRGAHEQAQNCATSLATAAEKFAKLEDRQVRRAAASVDAAGFICGNGARVGRAAIVGPLKLDWRPQYHELRVGISGTGVSVQIVTVLAERQLSAPRRGRTKFSGGKQLASNS